MPRPLCQHCKVVLMTGLLRELVLEAVHAPLDDDRNGRMGHIEALILDEIRTLTPSRCIFRCRTTKDYASCVRR